MKDERLKMKDRGSQPKDASGIRQWQSARKDAVCKEDADRHRTKVASKERMPFAKRMPIGIGQG